MSQRDLSPKRGPTPPQESQCSRSLHTPLYDEWFVHKPCGTIVDQKDTHIPGYGHIISKYIAMKIGWEESFPYVSESSGIVVESCTRKQALELADRHRDRMNIEKRTAVAFWRYVRPLHVEVDFPKCTEGTVIVERNYWEKIRNTASFSYTARLKKFFMRYKDPLSGETCNTTLPAYHLGIKAPLKIHFFDGDRLHLCLPNLRVRETPVAKQKRPAMKPCVKAELLHNPKGQYSHYRIHAVRYYPIPNDVPVEREPESFTNDRYGQQIGIVRESGFLFWKQTYTRHLRKHLEAEDEETMEAMREEAEAKVAAIRNYWSLKATD